MRQPCTKRFEAAIHKDALQLVMEKDTMTLVGGMRIRVYLAC